MKWPRRVNNNIPLFPGALDVYIQYAVVLFSFDTAGFEVENGSGDGPLAEQDVEVVTAFARGPKPRKSAPPGYTDEDWIRINRHEMQRGLRSHFL